MIKRAMLLCAGFGSRLAPLTELRPKPMLPVGNIPILKHTLHALRAAGIEEIVINTHHLPDVFLQEISPLPGQKIHFLHEEKILGTGGGLKNALHLLDPDGADDPFISMNGKLLFGLDLESLEDDYAKDSDCLGLLVVRDSPNKKFSALDVREESDGKLRLHNVFEGGEHMFCGVHVTRPSVVRRLPDGECCMIRQGYLPWLKSGERVRAFDAGDVYFAEHSTPHRYLVGNIATLGPTTMWTRPESDVTGGEVHPSAKVIIPSAIADGAIIEAGAIVGPNAVIGSGAIVREGVTISNSVVWDNAVVEEDADWKVITPAHVVDAKHDIVS